jgi:hypothetical protein
MAEEDMAKETFLSGKKRRGEDPELVLALAGGANEEVDRTIGRCDRDDHPEEASNIGMIMNEFLSSSHGAIFLLFDLILT